MHEGPCAHTGRMEFPHPTHSHVAHLDLLFVASPVPAARELADALQAQGCGVRLADGPRAMRIELARHAPQLLLLDGAEALESLRQLREGSRLPAVVLVPPGPAVERVIALESGADDALAHPVLPRELLARLRALLRRSLAPPAGTRMLRFGRWQLDRWTRQLQPPDGAPVQLSQAECRLLQTFLEHPGSVLARDELMDLARGRSIDAFERSIDLLVSRLRAKLADDPREPRFIRTVRGVGYLFEQFGIERPATLLPRYQDDTAA